MGWWPSKLIVLLNLVVLLGYSLIDCVIAGQILSAVSTGGNMSVVVGKNPVPLFEAYLMGSRHYRRCCHCLGGNYHWYISVPSLRAVSKHFSQGDIRAELMLEISFAFVPQFIVLCILFGTAGKYFDTTTASQGDPRTIAGNR